MKSTRAILLIVQLFIAVSVTATPPDTLHFTEDYSNQNLRNKGHYLLTNHGETFQEIRTKSLENWKPFNSNVKTGSGQTLWIHFFIKNKNPVDSLLFFTRNSLDKALFYVIDRNKISIQESGALVKRRHFDLEEGIGYVNYPFPYKSTREIFIEIPPVAGAFPFARIMPIKPVETAITFGNNTKKEHYLTRYFQFQTYEIQIRNLYQGALLLVSLVSLFFLIQNGGDRVYLYYFLYVNSALFYSLLQSRGYTYIGQFFQEWPYFKKYGNEIFLWTGIAGYVGFSSHLLDLPSQKPAIYQKLRKIMAGGICFALIYYLYQWAHNDNFFREWVKVYTRIPLLLFYFWFFWYLFRYIKSPLLKYIFMGNLLLVILACVAWVKDVQHGPAWPGILNNLFTLPLAVLSEVVVFSFALVTKQKISDREKNDMEKRVAETEMLALRSQMNPHFIFNSLSSIRNLVIKNEREKAIEYLSRFSKLVRLILQQTRRQKITLEEELELLRLYVQSESDRLDGPIEFEIITDKEIATDEILFPPMILQPAAENAIWHGLQPSGRADKKILLTLRQVNETHLRISLIDNGIGRKKANELKSKENYERVSLGYEITLRRLELFNSTNREQIHLEIIDLPDESGTEVVFDYFT